MAQNPPKHHKEIAQFLKSKIGGEAAVTIYRDNAGGNPVPIASLTQSGQAFYSTIGAFELGLVLPPGNYELSAVGGLSWLPNTVASSVYYLLQHPADAFPIICEDVVRHNAQSTYRHMAYVPSAFSFPLSTGQDLRWLLGVPIRDCELQWDHPAVLEKARQVFPAWLVK